MSELSFSVTGVSAVTFPAELWIRKRSCDVTDFYHFFRKQSIATFMPRILSSIASCSIFAQQLALRGFPAVTWLTVHRWLHIEQTSIWLLLEEDYFVEQASVWLLLGEEYQR